MACWAPLVPISKVRLGLDEASLGLLLLCLGLGSFIVMPATGALCRRFGCRTVVMVAAGAATLTVNILAETDSVVISAFCLLAFGGGVGAMDVALNIRAVVLERNSGRSLMSGFHGFFSLGGIVGAGGMSLLLWLGLSPVIGILAVSAAICALLVWSASGLLAVGDDHPAVKPAGAAPNPIVLLIGSMCFLVFLSEGAVLDWGALLLIDLHQIEAGPAGFGYACFAIALALGRLTGDAIVRALGAGMVLAGGGVVGAAGIALALSGPGAVWSCLGFLVMGLGVANVVPVLFTAAARRSPSAPGASIALIATMGYAGIFAGPAMIGPLAAASSLVVPFSLMAASLVLVALCWRVASAA